MVIERADKAPRTAGQVAAALIRERILTGEFAPGEPLNQAELAQALGMSRIPIRDALQSLAAEGLVVLRAHASATVTPLRLSDLEELYEIRLALEPRLSRYGVGNMSEGDRVRFESAYSALGDQSHQGEWIRANGHFHASLYRLSQRPRSIEIIDRARRATERYAGASVNRRPEATDLEHRLIYEAVVAGDAVRVEDLVATHLSSGFDMVIQMVADHPGL